MIDKHKWIDKLSGGKADGKTPSDFNEDDVNIGSKVQREHTTDVDIEKKISMDHLSDSDTYYDELVMSGIADEKDALDTYDKVKTDEDKKKAIDKIQKHLDQEKAKLKENHIITKFQEFIK